MRVPIDRLIEVAQTFHDASRDIAAVSDRLEEAVRSLQESWEEANQQLFFEYYREYQDHSAGIPLLLAEVGEGMRAIAEAFRTADTM